MLVAILFGYGHYYKGPAGIVDSGIAGLILAHGSIDTFAVVVVYFGWHT